MGIKANTWYYFLKLYLNTILTLIHVQIYILNIFIKPTKSIHRSPSFMDSFTDSLLEIIKLRIHPHMIMHMVLLLERDIVTETLSKMHGLYSEANERQA